MSSTNLTQATLTEYASREYDLAWTPNNPNRGATEPALYWPTVKRYIENPEKLPYEIPTHTISADFSRRQHKTYYWLVNDFHRFECPDCGRSPEEVKGVHVHHIDENPFNGTPENLVALCGRCHLVRHKGRSISSLSVEEWKDEFLENVGGEV